MSNNKKNFFSTITNKLENSGFNTKSFLLSDNEVGAYWDSTSYVCTIGSDNYGLLFDNLNNFNKIKFPKYIDSTKSYIDFTKSLNKEKLNTTIFQKIVYTGGVINKNKINEVSVRDYYCPLKKYPTLFKEFSDLELNKDSILNFANKYGMLGGDIVVKLHGQDYYESIFAWFWEIYHMNLCMKLFQYSEDEAIIFSEVFSNEILRNYFSIDGDEIHLDIKKDYQNPFVPAQYFIENFHILDSAEKDMPLTRILPSLAGRYIQKTIEDHLDHRLKIHYNKELRNTPHSLISIKVEGLIGALWLQFYQYAAGLTKFGFCQTCGNWFLQSDQRVVTRKKFCSNKCKISHSRGSENENKVLEKLKKNELIKFQKHEVIQLQQGKNFRADLVFYNNKKKDLINIIELKTRKKRAKEDSFSQLDEAFNLNNKINTAFVVFQDGIWGRTKNNKNWKLLGSVNDRQFNPFIKL